jgi:predicted ATPase/DNA-binding CsgD family transcriptional regulator
MRLGLTRQRLGQLPVEVTGFVGRRRELAELDALLRGARLVTVCGPGGVGKTRAALRAVAAAAQRFDDGVCLVELSGLRDADLLPDTVAACLGLPRTDSRSRLDAILDFLRDRRLLLILDTCEHLLDACAMFADVVLRSTAGLTVLATSRQPLDVPGEHTCAIAPLPAGSAIELFAQCAATVVPGFAITGANRAAAEAVCARVDGVPLAIELAAVRLRALSLEQLAAGLEDRFRLLTGGRRATLPHHQTLQAATEWSYDLCTPAEQLLWARLSVFAGTFDVAAVEQVCGGDPLEAADLLATLIGLVDKSVVLRVDGEGYRLLDTIREFGAGKLAATGSAGTLRDRHIARYTAMASYWGDHLIDDGQLPRYRELRREHPNLRAALDYALAADRDLDAARLASSLWVYWQLTGGMREGRYWLAKVRDRLTTPSSERAWVLVAEGFLASSQGETDAGLALMEQGVAVAAAAGDRVAGARGRVYLNLALTLAGRYAEAAAAGFTAAELTLAADDLATLIMLDFQVAYLCMESGDVDAGIARARQGLARFAPGSSELWGHGHLYQLLGFGHFLRGEHAEAAGALADGLVLQTELGDLEGIGYALEGLALLAATNGRWVRAAWLHGAADPLWALLGTRLGGDVRLQVLRDGTEQMIRDGLGEEAFGAVRGRGAGYPRAELVRLAIADADELPSVATAAAAAPALTSRESQIATLVADGLSNREIAGHLVISKRTVDAHLEHIFGKLGVSSRLQLVNWLRSDAPAGGAVSG